MGRYEKIGIRYISPFLIDGPNSFGRELRNSGVVPKESGSGLAVEVENVTERISLCNASELCNLLREYFLQLITETPRCQTVNTRVAFAVAVAQRAPKKF